MYWPYLRLKFTVHPVCVFVVLLSSLYTRFVTEHTCFSEKHWNVGFVNFGRGNVIDDVIYALDNKFSASVHDVFNVETLPKSSQLWIHSNVSSMCLLNNYALLWLQSLASNDWFWCEDLTNLWYESFAFSHTPCSWSVQSTRCCWLFQK